MRTVTYTKVLYTYSELSEEAKENVKQWYLDDEMRAYFFHDDIVEELKMFFPYSSLRVDFSLSYCQGDGLNIWGDLNLFDFIDKWEATEKEKARMTLYLENSNNIFTFHKNNHYSYSCKFIDKKYIDEYITEKTEELKDNGISRINTDTIQKFYRDMLDYFEDLDKQFEKDGYKYFYEVSDEELADYCEANEYEFDIDGNIM